MIFVLFYGCYGIKDYPFKHSLFYKSKKNNDVIKKIDYMFRKGKGFNYITVSTVLNKSKIIYGIDFNNNGYLIKITRLKANETITKCIDFKEYKNRNIEFRTVMVSDTIDFRFPKLNGIIVDTYIDPDIFKNVDKKDVKIEKVSFVEKNILSKTYDICLLHGIKLNPFDTSKFVAWFKYVGKCK